MNKIKRQVVEELLQACVMQEEEYKRGRTSQEYHNLVAIIVRMHSKLYSFFENSKTAEFIADITRAFAQAGYSISRLLKCLEVCGIEVVE